ncbi:hypothetical protein HDV05_004112, partial [Chytridiales sp. JEL 0842]
GTALPGESVSFQRDTKNQYGWWAIRAVNLGNEIIGLLPREQSTVFAKLVDANQIRMQGLVVGAKGNYELPVAIEVFKCGGMTGTELKADLQESGIILSEERASYTIPAKRKNNREEQNKKKRRR